MVTTDLPSPIHHVWDRRERVLVIDTRATPAHVAQAWEEVTGVVLATPA